MAGTPDPEKILQSSPYNYEDWRFYGSYSTDKETYGYKMHKGISSKAAQQLPVFGASCLMDIPKSTVGSMEIFIFGSIYSDSSEVSDSSSEVPEAELIGVSTKPGATELTRIP